MVFGKTWKMEKHVNTIHIFIILWTIKLFNLNEQKAYNKTSMALRFHAISIFIEIWKNILRSAQAKTINYMKYLIWI